MLIRFAPDQSGYPLENIVKKPESCVQRSLEKSGKKKQKWWFKFKSMPVIHNLVDSSKETWSGGVIFLGSDDLSLWHKTIGVSTVGTLIRDTNAGASYIHVAEPYMFVWEGCWIRNQFVKLNQFQPMVMTRFDSIIDTCWFMPTRCWKHAALIIIIRGDRCNTI